MFPPGPDHVLGTDFYVPEPRRSSRMVRLLALITLTCVIASVALPPLVHAWESGQRSHEFTFMATIGGAPVRWNPCEPIHYVVNLGAAPAGSLQDVQDAVLRLSGATGIAFTYDGLTDEVPTRYRDVYQPDRYGDRWAPVLIGWVDPRTSTFDFDPGGREAAGVAGPLYPDPGPATIYVSGVVAINVADPEPTGVRVPGGARPGRDARAGPRAGSGPHQGPGRVDGAIGWRRHRPRSGGPRRAQRAGTFGGLPHDPASAVSLLIGPGSR